MTTTTNTISAFTDDCLSNYDTVGLVEQLNARQVSSEELVNAAIIRAEKVNPELNAIVVKAYKEAQSESKCPRSGAFSGVPTFVKDSDDVEGLVTVVGSAAIKLSKAKKDSSFVKQLRQVGLVNIGKSAMPEFGLTGSTEALSLGPTLNPWNIDYTPGGSSGGATALVASGVVSIAHANDGAGSIRIPASCCGLVGLKPTRGRTALVDGSRVLPVNILHQGVVTRTVRDTAAFYEALEQRPGKQTLPAIGRVSSPGKKRIKVALVTDGADHECSLAAEEAARLLGNAGHNIEAIPLPFAKQVSDDFFILWRLMAFGFQRFGSFFFGKGFDGNKTEPFTKNLNQDFTKQFLKAPLAFRRLKKFSQEYAQFFTEYDCLLTPTLGHAPPKVGHLSTAEPYDVCLDRIRKFFPYTPYQNISGAPAITMPFMTSNAGLPIGVQFAGAWGQEKQLLELAYEFEEISNWKHLFER